MRSKGIQKTYKFLLWVGVLTTLAINPWFAYDPINLPKMLTISTGAAFLLGWLFFNTGSWSRSQIPFLATSLLFLIFLIISFVSNSAPWYQQLWGTWGRSTGLITYFSFIIIMIASSRFASSESLGLTRVLFERLGYFISFYTLMQWMQLDPINWSQKLMVATLGNLNFMSSFLGLTTISYLSRIFFERAILTKKLFFVFLSLLNFSLIFASGSIQGMGVILTGATILLATYIKQKFNSIKSLVFIATALTFGSFSLLGTAGMGPLSAFLQETVLYRLDYWKAGITMFIANPANGVGIDSYGDYYRQYRDLDAVTRTGPQRVTNTAHNIFIDVFASSGIVSGVLFILLAGLTFAAILRVLKSQDANSDFQALAAIWFGFMTFCLISINQIGVGVWGFIFTGLLNGYASCSAVQESSGKSAPRSMNPSLKEFSGPTTAPSKVRSPSFFKIGMFQPILSGFFSVVIFLLTLMPNLADARILSSTKSQNLDLAIRIIELPGVQDFHTEQVMTRLAQQGRNRESLELALLLVKRNPQNWQAWVQILSSPLSTRNQQIGAAQNLFRLDPNNSLVRREIEAFLNP